MKEWACDRLEDFRTVTWKQGTRGRLRGRFAAWRVRPAHRLSAGKEPLAPIWLLAESPSGEAEPTKFYFVNLPETASLRQLVQTVKARWLVEQSYKELKDELGLDHFEGRSWPGWHHHVSLTLMAYAFLQTYRRRQEKRGVACADTACRAQCHPSDALLVVWPLPNLRCPGWAQRFELST